MECCVCYNETTNKTICHRSLCGECEEKLKGSPCPICRKTLKYIIKFKCYNCGIEKESLNTQKFDYPLIYNCALCKAIRCFICTKLMKNEFGDNYNYNQLQNKITTDHNNIIRHYHSILLLKDSKSVYDNKYFHLHCYKNHLKLNES